MYSRVHAGFGEGDRLTKEFDLTNAAERHRAFVKSVNEHLGQLDYVNVMEPTIIMRDETFPIKEEMICRQWRVTSRKWTSTS